MANTKRIAVWTVSVVAGAIVLLIGREIYLAATATPSVTVDYSTFVNGRVREANAGFAQSRAKSQAMADESRPVSYARFVDLLNAIADADSAAAKRAFPDEKTPGVEYSLLFTSGSESDAAQRELAKQCMADNVASGRVGDLAELPGLVGVSREIPAGVALVAVLLPELQPARQAARLLNARFVLAIREGREDEAIAALEQIVALGTILTHQATLIDRLVGIAIHSLALSSIRDEFAAGRIDAELAARMLPILQRCDQRPATTMQLETEYNNTMDIVQRTHTAGGRFIPEAYNKIVGASGYGAPSSALAAFLPRREESERRIKELYAKVFDQAKLPRATRDFGTIERSIVDGSKGFDISRGVMPAFGNYFSSEDQFLTTLHGVQILLALEMHRAKTGVYPQSLSELTPSIFAALPADVIAKDQQFRYKLRPQGVTAGRPFLLYSIGNDQTDNDAKEHATLDITALTSSSSSAGYDFVVNRKSPEETAAAPK
ncbi:hypothetical protein LBMAG48_12880 [Phycisphaerae bacterium]|nr:hypothetical protein LBMAG48_12880 [Phycisphaerae bacterium]